MTTKKTRPTRVIGKPSAQAKKSYLWYMNDPDFNDNYKGKEKRDFLKEYFIVKFEVSYRK